MLYPLLTKPCPRGALLVGYYYYFLLFPFHPVLLLESRLSALQYRGAGSWRSMSWALASNAQTFWKFPKLRLLSAVYQFLFTFQKEGQHSRDWIILACTQVQEDALEVGSLCSLPLRQATCLATWQETGLTSIPSPKETLVQRRRRVWDDAEIPCQV